jgi:A/G-specific adenine glycosylase
MGKTGKGMLSKLPHGNRINFYVKALGGWFQEHGRIFPWREQKASVFVQVLSEFFLQRTRASAVAGFLPSFVERYPNWEAIAISSEEELRKYVECLGLWRSRVPSLQGAARRITNYGGYPEDRRSIELLPGVGQYIANAIELYCHHQPRPLLDATMARCLERYFGERKLVDIRYDPYLQSLAQKVIEAGDPVKTNWAILDLGAMLCKPTKPLCEQCPLVKKCSWFIAHC